MKINWKVRIKNKMFWITLLPIVFLLVKQVCVMFGVEVDFTTLEAQIMNIVETVFMLFGVLGIVVDSTTAGIGDSEQALTYDKPKNKE